MPGFEVTQPPTQVELDRANELLILAGFDNWIATGVRGAGGDPSLYRAERILRGSRHEVYHPSAEKLVELVREVEARLPANKPTPIASGSADSSNY